MSAKGIQLKLLFPVFGGMVQLPYVSDISAGFPSQPGDIADSGIDLNETFIRNETTTFFGRVKGSSMIDCGIGDGDLLIIDRSIPVRDGAIVVCCLDGEYTVKRIKFDQDCCWLIPENEQYEPIKVTHENEFVVWGTVAHTVKSF